MGLLRPLDFEELAVGRPWADDVNGECPRRMESLSTSSVVLVEKNTALR